MNATKLFSIIFLFFGLYGNAFSMGAKRPATPKKATSFKNTKHSSCVNDVYKKMSKIARKPRKTYRYKVNSRIFKTFGYRMSPFNKNRFGIENHFQGIEKMKGHHNFLFTGGDYKRKEAHLFVIDRGRVSKKIKISSGRFWHSGGIQRAGDVLAIPIETWKTGKRESKIKFYDIRDFRNPKVLPIEIYMGKPDFSAGFHRRKSDGKYILTSHAGTFTSKTSNILDGFHRERIMSKWWDRSGNGNSIIQDCKTKELFLISFDNDGKYAPIKNGNDNAKLFKLHTDGKKPQLIKRFKFKCGYLKCNFAAGTTIVEERGKLVIYSIGHYRRWFGRRVFVQKFY